MAKKVKVLGFEWRLVPSLTLTDFATQVTARGHQELATLTAALGWDGVGDKPTVPSEIILMGNRRKYLVGMVTSISDTDSILKVKPGVNGPIAEAEAVGTGERLMSFAFFLIHPTPTAAGAHRGLLASYRQSMTVTQFNREMISRRYESGVKVAEQRSPRSHRRKGAPAPGAAVLVADRDLERLLLSEARLKRVSFTVAQVQTLREKGDDWATDAKTVDHIYHYPSTPIGSKVDLLRLLYADLEDGVVSKASAEFVDELGEKQPFNFDPARNVQAFLELDYETEFKPHLGFALKDFASSWPVSRLIELARDTQDIIGPSP